MIPVCEPPLDGKELEYVQQAMVEGWISSGGHYLNTFEKEFAAYCGCKYGVSTTNGTAALHLALAVLGIGPGDEVLVPDFTIAACAFAVLYTGATPVFIDCDPETWNIDARGRQIEEVINRRTRAIMPVHLYGRPCDMSIVMSLAQTYDLAVIEDAAEAHGATYRGRKVGSIGDIGCFSFYSNKLLATGEGGMVVTNNEKLAERAKSLKNLAHSPKKRFYHHEVGFNYRMTNIQAAIGLAQLESLDDHIAVRIRNARLYDKLLEEVPGLTLIHENRHYVKSVSWMYCLLVDSEKSRDGLMAHLEQKGIQTRTLFVPMHRQPMFRTADSKFPVAMDISSRGLYLPSGTGLTTDQIMAVCESVKEYMKCAW